MILTNQELAELIIECTEENGNSVNEGTESSVNLLIGKDEGGGIREEEIGNIVETLDQISEVNAVATNNLVAPFDWKIISSNGYPT